MGLTMNKTNVYSSVTALLVISLFSKVLAQDETAHPPINTMADPWEVSDWFNSPPLELENLRGNVVLVRWWTGPSCPFCLKSAESLNELYDNYSDRGLVVIGLYHHKSYEPLDKKNIKQYSDNMGFQFPVAIDHDWKTLNRWWLHGQNHGWTSVSFLIDKEGIIRYVHPGGQYVKGDSSYQEIKNTIEVLLSEEVVD